MVTCSEYCCLQGMRCDWSTTTLPQSLLRQPSLSALPASCRCDAGKLLPFHCLCMCIRAAGNTDSNLQCAICCQGMQGSNLLEAAAQQQERRRRRRKLLDKVKQEGYTPGTGFNMEVLQQKTDSVAACTSRCASHHSWVAKSCTPSLVLLHDMAASQTCTSATQAVQLGGSKHPWIAPELFSNNRA